MPDACVFLLALAMSGVPAAPRSQDEPERGAREAAARYAEGLRRGDVSLLEGAFAPDGQFVRRTEDGGARSQPFREILAGWARTPDPAVAFEVTQVTVATNDLVAVTGRLRMTASCYNDQLLLGRLKAGWRILAKTTQPAPCEGFPTAASTR